LPSSAHPELVEGRAQPPGRPRSTLPVILSLSKDAGDPAARLEIGARHRFSHALNEINGLEIGARHRFSLKVDPSDFKFKPWPIGGVGGIGRALVLPEGSNEEDCPDNANQPAEKRNLEADIGKLQPYASQAIGFSYRSLSGPLGAKIGIIVILRLIAVGIICLGGCVEIGARHRFSKQSGLCKRATRLR
jgi:hypothetical protein